MGSASQEKEALSLAREVRRLTFGDLDATAQQEARRLASECGKPATREQGLLAIHAILQRRGEPNSTDQHAAVLGALRLNETAVLRVEGAAR